MRMQGAILFPAHVAKAECRRASPSDAARLSKYPSPFTYVCPLHPSCFLLFQVLWWPLSETMCKQDLHWDCRLPRLHTEMCVTSGPALEDGAVTAACTSLHVMTLI